MANGNGTKYRHFILSDTSETQPYRSPLRGEDSSIKPQNRLRHGSKLRQQIDVLRSKADATRQVQQDTGVEGIQVEFESFPDIKRAFENLAREHWGIELLNIRRESNRTYATVFVPDGKLDHFERLIHNYLIEKRDKNGKAIDNRKLIDTIREIRVASLQSLWTDAIEIFPTVDDAPFWWEVWLPIRGNQEATAEAFRGRAETLGMQVTQGNLMFPERTVLLVRASLEQMQGSMTILNNIAELRRAKETADFFDDMPIGEQHAWLDDLLKRIQYPSEEENVPYVCLLDTGVNRGHPLLAPVFATDDLHTVEPGWGVDDAVGHGTKMAGLALTGDLTQLLVANDLVEINHRLESVKLLHQNESSEDDPLHHGYLTKEAVARPEITAPSRHRVFNMAITARDNRDRGKPSAWSAAIDSLTSDYAGFGDQPRLLIVSAGNVEDLNAISRYPDSNDSDGIHDPAQAWNALTVGAYTDLDRIDGADTNRYRPIAPAGGLSPYSTTSLIWEPHWPLKPDVVFEGGNVAEDTLGAVGMSSLNLLTTYHELADRVFTTANATSAATALASRFAAQIMAVYPDLWPETIRALIVHSAEWTDAMMGTFMPAHGNGSKKDYLKLVRRCGFGVPDLDRALWSVADSLTMVVEESLHPFKRETG
ncbi:MAG: S8 family peptidase, partial [Candidatus Poribacteria bacterium]|nr:S8 family peptidase [Candidatus Poribacteria bacterium]